MSGSIHQRASTGQQELSSALKTCRSAFIAVAVVTGFVNLLYLTGSFYMLEIYDRVIPSRSIPTLIGLSILALILYAFQGILDLLRGRILLRIGHAVDDALSPRIFDAVVGMPLRAPPGADPLRPSRDLDQVRGFLSSLGPPAFFDLPWMPLYLGLCFLFHFWIGITALIGAILLVGLTILTNMLTRGATAEAVNLLARRNALADASRRNAEVLQAMGMTRHLYARWHKANEKSLETNRSAADVTGGFGAVSKILRMVLQSAVLAVGAYLVIEGQASAGIIIASSILTSRAMAPVEQAIAHWNGFLMARQSWRRLGETLTLFPAQAARLSLPRPVGTLSVEGLSAAAPAGQRLIVQDVSFGLKAGNGLGIVGPSASGKSSLARALVGTWRPVRGKVRLDGASLDQWPAEDLGRHVGYLPQDVELFSGTVAENIARFDPQAGSEKVIEAAQAAGVHELILRLPEGYETQIGDSGAALSAGQRQRIGLARALYGNPFLVVLDEPNSNLDIAGEEALTKAILGVRARQGIVVVIAHRPSALAGVDLVLVMADGKATSFGRKEEILPKIMPRPVAPPPGLKVVAEGAAS